MIRGSDLPNAAVWTQTAIATPRVPSDARTRDASSWFRADAMSASSISGDVSAAARGLSVEQHAAAVLAHLRGEPEAIA